MMAMTRLVAATAAVFAVAALAPVRADDVKPSDEGNAAAFKGKKIEMKDGDKVAYLLTFDAGTQFEATTNGPKQTDVHLYVYDETGKEVGKDDTTGPVCSVKFTPAVAGKFKFLVTNAKGDNTVSFEVKTSK